jgi:hypothetical protein
MCKKAVGPCKKKNGGCHAHADCTEKGKKAMCKCHEGWMGNGKQCQPICDDDTSVVPCKCPMGGKKFDDCTKGEHCDHEGEHGCLPICDQSTSVIPCICPNTATLGHERCTTEGQKCDHSGSHGGGCYVPKNGPPRCKLLVEADERCKCENKGTCQKGETCQKNGSCEAAGNASGWNKVPHCRCDSKKIMRVVPKGKRSMPELISKCKEECLATKGCKTIRIPEHKRACSLKPKCGYRKEKKNTSTCWRRVNKKTGDLLRSELEDEFDLGTLVESAQNFFSTDNMMFVFMACALSFGGAYYFAGKKASIEQPLIRSKVEMQNY